LIGPLRELGYVDGQTARYEVRSAQNDLDRLPDLATDLVRTPIDISDPKDPSSDKKPRELLRLTLAVRAETPIDVLLDVIQPYPTFSEAVFLALRELNLDL